jgi:hypothetical protein
MFEFSDSRVLTSSIFMMYLAVKFLDVKILLFES